MDEQNLGVGRATAAEPVVSALRDGIPDAGDNPVVGWGTTTEGKHVPIRKDFADRLWAAAEAQKAKRIADMPTERDAIFALHEAYRRLEELGWKNPVYAPKDGSALDLIECGSTGIHSGYYEGKWPDGSWWIMDDDIWPSRPVLARPAQGIEAGTVETARLDAQHESPVRQDAPISGSPTTTLADSDGDDGA